MSHTATPWKVHYDENLVQIQTSDGLTAICDVGSVDDAEFIVHVCNLYDELTSAVLKARKKETK
mgnify:CR=1 FL=1